MTSALTAVESIYFQVQQKLSVLLAACKTDEEHDAVVAQYVEARKNYLECLNGSFHDTDPALIKLVAQAQKSAVQLGKIEAQLADIAKVIDTLTTAVSYGTKIAAKLTGH